MRCELIVIVVRASLGDYRHRMTVRGKCAGQSCQNAFRPSAAERRDDKCEPQISLILWQAGRSAAKSVRMHDGRPVAETRTQLSRLGPMSPAGFNLGIDQSHELEEPLGRSDRREARRHLQGALGHAAKLFIGQTAELLDALRQGSRISGRESVSVEIN